jgi:DNA-directed RNA polymerase specialized sigma24 family protein
LLAWVNTIALNLLRNSCRSARARGGVEINDRTLHSDSFEARVAASLDVHYLMIRLKPKDASLVKRCYLDGQTTAEASAQCSASPLALRLRLHRAVSRLRESVQHREALGNSEHAALTHAA